MKIKKILQDLVICWHGYEPANQCTDCKEVVNQAEADIIQAVMEMLPEEKKAYKTLAIEFGKEWTQGYNACLSELKTKLKGLVEGR